MASRPSFGAAASGEWHPVFSVCAAGYVRHDTARYCGKSTWFDSERTRPDVLPAMNAHTATSPAFGSQFGVLRPQHASAAGAEALDCVSASHSVATASPACPSSWICWRGSSTTVPAESTLTPSRCLPRVIPGRGRVQLRSVRSWRVSVAKVGRLGRVSSRSRSPKTECSP